MSSCSPLFPSMPVCIHYSNRANANILSPGTRSNRFWTPVETQETNMNVFVQVGVKSGSLLRENEPFFLLLGRRRARSIGKGPPSRNGGYSNMWCLHCNIHCLERDILHTKERVKCWMRISVRSSSGLTRFAHFEVSSKTFGRAASSAKSSITGGASLGKPYSMR